MTIGLLRIELRIFDSQSLKDKRSVLLRLKNSLRKKYNISVAEIEEKDKWQKVTLAIAHVVDNRNHADRTMSNIVDYISTFNDLEIIDYQTQLL